MALANFLSEFNIFVRQANILTINSMIVKSNFLNETKNPLILLQNIENCEINDSDFFNNVVSQNIISIVLSAYLNIQNLTLIDNLSQNSLSIENCDEIIISIFGCLNNNRNSEMINSFDYFSAGSCLRAINFLNISISSGKVTGCQGVLNLPGFFRSKSFFFIVWLGSQISTQNH